MAEEWLEEGMELMQVVKDRGDIEFFELTKGDLQIRFSRSAMTPMTALPSEVPTIAPAPPAVQVEQPLIVTESTVPPPASKANKTPSAYTLAEKEGTELIRSPMVGTFYSAPEPGAPPFVQVGMNVAPDTTMGLVEAMKVFTAVRAGVTGAVEEVFAQNEQLIQYQEPIFRIRLA